jgi:hypothetical protein
MNRFAPTFIGIVSATLAGSLVAQGLRPGRTRLIAPEEKAWFKRQSPAIQKAVIAELRSAKACVADYSKRDGTKDAMTAAGLSQPRFYSGVSNGVVIYRTVPGIRGCSPEFINQGQGQDQIFDDLPALWHGPPRGLRGQELCGAAASRYAAAFNKTLAVMKPDAFHAACPTGQLEGK